MHKTKKRKNKSWFQKNNTYNIRLFQNHMILKIHNLVSDLWKQNQQEQLLQV